MTTITIPEYSPSASATVSVKFPGERKAVEFPTSGSLRIGQLRKIVEGAKNGDLGVLLDVFGEPQRTLLETLRPEQLNAFIEAWIGAGETAEGPKD